MDQSQSWKSIFSDRIDWNQAENDFAANQKRRKQQQNNRRQKQKQDRTTMVLCATHLKLQQKYGHDSIRCEPMQERSIYKHYLSHMFPTRDNELAFGLKYGFHDIYQKRLFYLASEVVDNEPIANLPELETSQFEQWKNGKDESYCFFKEMAKKEAEFEESREKHNAMAQKLAQKDSQFALVSTYWKVMNQTEQEQTQNPIATNTNNNTCNESNSIIIDSDSNAISEHESDDDVINEMTETIRNWNEKKTQRKNNIYNIDSFDYDINTNDKEYQSLVNYKPNWQQSSLDFYFGFSDKRIEIDTNSDNDDIDIEIAFENDKMESKACVESVNDNDNNSNSIDNDIAMNGTFSNDIGNIASDSSIIDEYEAKLQTIQSKLDAMESEKELAEIKCLCFDDILLKLSDMYLRFYSIV